MKNWSCKMSKSAFSILLAGALVFSGVPVRAAESGYTAVKASTVKSKGMFQADIGIELIGRYNSGVMHEDGGSAEIVAYDSDADCMYVVNGIKGTLDRVPAKPLAGKSSSVIPLSGTEINVSNLLKSDSFTYGDMTSVAVNSGLVAVAVQAEDYAARGRVAVFETTSDGTLRLAVTFMAGVQPDMLTFTADGSKILVANEGEPRKGTGGENPAGSVTIVRLDRSNLSQSRSVTVGFGSYDSVRDSLTADGVVIRKNTKPSVDFEPEYIVVSQDGKTAYVALQEANAIAVLDVEKAVFTGVYGLGVKDFGAPGNALDLLNDGQIEIVPQKGVYGLYMPDGISVYETSGKTYLLTANEGDSRADWSGLEDEVESKKSPTGNVTLSEEAVWFDATLYDGLNQNRAYIFGGRSFSVWEMTSSAGPVRIYDSGSEFERLTSRVLPENFNCSNNKISLDNRSGKKGVEPECVITGVVGNKVYAFIGLERIGGVMVYDITDISQIKFVNYINSREFGGAIQGDVAPEGLCFIPAGESITGNPLLLTACEVSGTVAVYEIK